MRKLLIVAALLLPGMAFGAQKQINCASTPTACSSSTGPANTNTGDPAWKAFGKANENFNELYARTPTFDQIGTGVNTTGTFTIDTGSSLSAINSGVIAASSATQLAATPTQCAVGQAARGVDAFGNAVNCVSAAGSGNVSTSGSPAAAQLAVWASGTTIAGTAVGSNNIVCNAGAGITACNPAAVIQVLGTQTSNTQTGTSYAFALADTNNEVTMNNVSANKVCLPSNSDVAFPVGTILTVQQLGAGATTLTPAGVNSCADTGVTITSPQYGASSTQTYSLAGAYGWIQIQQTQTDTWNVLGWDVNGTVGTVGIANGGTGLTATPTDGQLLVGDGNDNSYHLATITAGSNVTVTNGHHSITIAASGTGGAAKQAFSFMCASVGQATTDYIMDGVGCPFGGNTTAPPIIAGTFKNLYIKTANTPASGQTFTVTLYTGAQGSLGSTAVTCQLTNGGGNTCNDTSDTATVAVGQAWALKIVTSATSGSTGTVGIGIEFDPS